MFIFTYISGKLFERVKHIEAMEVYDACCQGVIVSDQMLRTTRKWKKTHIIAKTNTSFKKLIFRRKALFSDLLL